MGEVRIFIDFDDEDDDQYLLYPSISSAEIIFCRICHEAEFESSKAMESPCSCSGTVKFAHRDCIQRWCDEKGNTTCEICLQEFEPGYSSSLKLIQNHRIVSLEVPETEVTSAIIVQQERTAEAEYPQCSSTADTSAYICRFFGLIVTLLLLVRHLCVLWIEGTGDYPFTLLTLLVMRASGIVIPMYIIMRTVDTIHKAITRRYQVPDDGTQRQAV
ncbi:putative transcription factor C2H2 family [Helianthus debilis subsp. tardiflorus]